MTYMTMYERVMTKKRSSDFWSRRKCTPEKILATPMLKHKGYGRWALGRKELWTADVKTCTQVYRCSMRKSFAGNAGIVSA